MRQTVARTRTWTASGTGIGRKRSRQAHRLRKRVAREVAAVFRAPGLAKAKKRLAEITARWHNELPEAMRVLERGFTAATQFSVLCGQRASNKTAIYLDTWCSSPRKLIQSELHKGG